MKLLGQGHSTEFNSSMRYSDNLAQIFEHAAELRVQAAMGEFEAVAALLADLGAAVSILKMATTNKDAKENLNNYYMGLKKKWRSQLLKMQHNGRFDYIMLDELEEFQDFLMQQTQLVGLGFTLHKDMGKKQKMRTAIRKA